MLLILLSWHYFLVECDSSQFIGGKLGTFQSELEALKVWAFHPTLFRPENLLVRKQQPLVVLFDQDDEIVGPLGAEDVEMEPQSRCKSTSSSKKELNDVCSSRTFSVGIQPSLIEPSSTIKRRPMMMSSERHMVTDAIFNCFW